MNENEEARLERLRENSRRYYQNHKAELAEKRKTARRAKLDAMSEEERNALRAKNAEYQREYRAKHPERVAIWTARTYLRKLERYGMELDANGQ